MKKPPAPDDRPSSRPAGTRPSTGVVVDRETVELKRLEKRIGRVHLQQRLGIEADHATQIFGRGRTVFHIENWYSIHALIRLTLRCLGLYGWGVRNATSIQIRHNEVVIPHLPVAFDGLTLLHLSDLHLDMADGYPAALIERLQQVQYDFCVMTGDFRAKTFGDYQVALAALAQVRDALHGPIYAVLGNHDSIRMTPGIEALGITLLLNEAVALELDGEVIHPVSYTHLDVYKRKGLCSAAIRCLSGANRARLGAWAGFATGSIFPHSAWRGLRHTGRRRHPRQSRRTARTRSRKSCMAQIRPRR